MRWHLTRSASLVGAAALGFLFLWGCSGNTPPQTPPARSTPEGPSSTTDVHAPVKAEVAPESPDAAAPAGNPSNDAVAASQTAKGRPPGGEMPKLLSREEIDAGWIALFDGFSLFGWTPNSNANWSVQDGTITADSGDKGLLLTSVRFADYELKCDYRLAKGGNSGIFLRTLFEPKDPATDCYELNMCDTHPAFGTASLVARVKPEQPILGEDGEWHSFLVRCEGTKITVNFDGKRALEFDDTGANVRREGLIGLQMNGGKVEFRNVFLRPLGEKPLFNGEDLAGWKVVPGSKSTFEVKEGAIHLENGPGFLETDGTYGDFVFQGQARTNGDMLNSGVFFRAEEGSEKAPSNGYEFQIQNGYKNGDRSEPADFGTGAIFRREKARWVVPNDREWFTFTLVADGPKFATWVDGVPVVVWKDDREPDDNPRKGSRTAPGHFSLQGHDPTTNLDFRALRVMELPREE